MNTWLDAQGLSPELEAVAVVGNPHIVVLLDTQETTGYRAPEDCYLALARLEEPIEWEHVAWALQAYVLGEDEQRRIDYQSDGSVHWSDGSYHERSANNA